MKSSPLSRRDRIRAQLADLKMLGALEALDGGLSQVDGGKAGGAGAIELVLGAQIALRNNRRSEAAMPSSRLPAVKTVQAFDFSFQPSIKREQIQALHELGFVERKENVGLRADPALRESGGRVTAATAGLRTRVIQPLSVNGDQDGHDRGQAAAAHPCPPSSEVSPGRWARVVIDGAALSAAV